MFMNTLKYIYFVNWQLIWTKPSIRCTFQIDFKTKFALYDKRGDGKIGSEELGDALRATGLNPSAEEVKKITKGFSGEIFCSTSLM